MPVVLCFAAYVICSSLIFDNIDSPKTPVSSNGTVNNVKTNSIAARTPIDLANLFAGGMPTLKATGLRDRGTILYFVTNRKEPKI